MCNIGYKHQENTNGTHMKHMFEKLTCVCKHENRQHSVNMFASHTVFFVQHRRLHGDVNFYLTQFLSGHGCFRKYLHRFGHAASPLCPECGNVEETPEHVVFDCPRFEEERREMPVLNVEDVVEEMCREEGTWNAVRSAVTLILVKLQRKWREDQRSSNVS